VFETSIRVLGGLVSGHVLLARDTSLVPGYDGLFLEKVRHARLEASTLPPDQIGFGVDLGA
jgi:hypothetical protein